MLCCARNIAKVQHTKVGSDNTFADKGLVNLLKGTREDMCSANIRLEEVGVQYTNSFNLSCCGISDDLLFELCVSQSLVVDDVIVERYSSQLQHIFQRSIRGALSLQTQSILKMKINNVSIAMNFPPTCFAPPLQYSTISCRGYSSVNCPTCSPVFKGLASFGCAKSRLSVSV